jgi:hypothetical protein
MSDLVEFLRARLDEDARVARTAASIAAAPWRWESLPMPHKYGLTGTRAGLRALIVPSRTPDVYPDKFTAEHIIRFDPARVLADVEAKRRIIERWEHATRDPDDFEEQWGLEWAMRALAQPYADHPDFDSGWKL